MKQTRPPQGDGDGEAHRNAAKRDNPEQDYGAPPVKLLYIVTIIPQSYSRQRAAEARMARILEFTLNGRRRVDAVPDNLLLLDYLREVVGLTGTKTGCDGGECGACTVLVD